MKYLNLSSDIYKKCGSSQKKLDLLANYLLKNIKMIINGTEYSLEEIEFYYYSDEHPDSYTHKDPDQMTNSEWYFHKYKNGTYKSGTYKGLDITFGNGKDFGGILIRSIMNLEDDSMVIGPCNVVNHIIKKTDCDSTEGLIDDMKNLKVDNEDNIFHLKIDENYDKKCGVFSGPRVGLSLKYPKYLVKDYRYLKQPDKMTKYKDTLVSSLHKNGKNVDEIYKLTRIKKAFIQKSIDEYNEGKKMTDVDENSKINKLYGFYSK